METLRMTGRRMVFWGALALVAWAVYELAIRFEEMVTWLSPVFSLVSDGKITFWDYLSRLEWARLRTHIFLVLCLLFGVFALLTRRRPIAGLISVPICILLIIFSLGSTPLMEASFWQKFKLIPAALVMLGNLLISVSNIQRVRRIKAGRDQLSHAPQPYDPFNIGRGQ